MNKNLIQILVENNKTTILEFRILKYSQCLEQFEFESKKFASLSMVVNHPSFDQNGFLFASWEELRENDIIVFRDIEFITEEDYWRWHTYLLSIKNKEILLFLSSNK